MTKAKRKAAVPATGKMAANERSAAPEFSTSDPVALVARGLALALVVVRFLVPTESAPDGDTLWIAQLWFAAALLWAWSGIRSGQFSLRAGAIDAALWTLVGAHWISTAFVFTQGGDRRAALNVAWEWTALGTAFFCLRQVVCNTADARRLASILVALGVVLGGFGIWQHYFFYRNAYDEYHRLVAELDTLQKNPASHAERISRIQLDLHRIGAPSDPEGRRQFENRLHYSSEPFGPFALANTFAGLLLVTLIATGELFRTAPRPVSKAAVVVWALAGVVQAYCLVLTKSRTAWVGLFVAAAGWSVCTFGQVRKSLGRRAIVTAAATVAAVFMLFAAAALSGGFDNEVISEARKSLRYRVQYWKGAGAVLRDHWIFGTGPGNFRHQYLAHKLPESSEEIADPHNWLLDLWTSGGLIALAGFTGCVISVVVKVARARRLGPRDGEAQHAIPDDSGSPSMTLWSASLGFLLACFAPLLAATNDFDPVPIALLCAWLIAFAVLRPDRGPAGISIVSLGAATLGLLVHLSGAGGIEMPAVIQLLLVIAVLAFAAAPRAVTILSSKGAVQCVAVGAAVLFACCLRTATLPVLNRRALVAEGEESLIRHSDFTRAIADFRAAAQSDPFSPDPPEKLAETFFSRWQSTPGPKGIEDFETGAAFLKLASSRDPQNPAPYRRLGELYRTRFARTGDPHDAQAAVDALTEAVTRYPNEASLRAIRAEALLDAGRIEEGRAEAAKALELNAINYREQHSDRYLPDNVSLRLRRIAKPSSK